MSRDAAVVNEGLKDSAESIVVAFILAFVFRAFIVEAFVIPTGSMAATLYGKHGTLVCEDCGWENVYGLTDLSSRPRRFGPQSTVICQNCNHPNSNLRLHDGLGPRGSPSRSGRSNAQSGDRILVLKWPLNIGGSLLGPHRWDVTVFKNPADGDENYIKRLVGLPNEVLEIIDGDVYTVPADQLSEAAWQALEEQRHLKFLRRSEQPLNRQQANRLAQGPPQAVLDELAEKLHICVKTPEAQESLWTVVYDHDYPPESLGPRQPRWLLGPTTGPRWTVEKRHLKVSGSGGGRGTIHFDGKAIVDHNAYNIEVSPSLWQPVSDLRLKAVLEFQGGDGCLELALPKGDDTFVARLYADGRALLVRVPTGEETSAGTVLAEGAVPPLSGRRLRTIAFQNVDYRVALDIDGEEVLATIPDQYAPDIGELRKRGPEPAHRPWMAASNMDLTLAHVVLYRDVYYTSPDFGGSPIETWARAGGWGTTGNPIRMRDDEYFMLGDNSPASKDSRLWDVVGDHLAERGEAYQLGTVPGDQLIGRAFFVYWPSGLRPDWLPVLRNFGIIPNVGDMRWIR